MNPFTSHLGVMTSLLPITHCVPWLVVGTLLSGPVPSGSGEMSRFDSNLLVQTAWEPLARLETVFYSHLKLLLTKC